MDLKLVYDGPFCFRLVYDGALCFRSVYDGPLWSMMVQNGVYDGGQSRQELNKFLT